MSSSTSRPRALLVFEASAAIGGGHMARCFALGDALSAEHDVSYAFNKSARALADQRLSAASDVFDDGQAQQFVQELAARTSDLPDLLVVDHYRVDAAAERLMRERGATVAVIDDLANRGHACDVLIDSNPSADATRYIGLAPSECRLLLGAGYALLRPEFRHARTEFVRSQQNDRSARVLVSMGATDPVNATALVLSELELASTPIEVTVIVGRGSPHARAIIDGLAALSYPARVEFGATNMADLYMRHDLAIGAPATSLLERACTGLPSIVIETADNQAELALTFEKSGAARRLGRFDKLEPGAVAKAVHDLIESSETRDEMSRKCSILVDGLGSSRTAANLSARFRTKDGQILTGRPLRQADASVILEWQSAPGARRYSRNSDPPQKYEHKRWVERRIAATDSVTEIITLGPDPVAMVRLDPRGADTEVSVLVAPEYAGRGVGEAAVRYISRFEPSRRKVAWVHPEHHASLALFKKCGYGANANLILQQLEGVPQAARS